MISWLHNWYPRGRFSQSISRYSLGKTFYRIRSFFDYLTRLLIRQIINIGHQSDGFYVTKVVYLLSNVGWWLSCQKSPQTHFSFMVISVKQVNEKYADVCTVDICRYENLEYLGKCFVPFFHTHLPSTFKGNTLKYAR